MKNKIRPLFRILLTVGMAGKWMLSSLPGIGQSPLSPKTESFAQRIITAPPDSLKLPRGLISPCSGRCAADRPR